MRTAEQIGAAVLATLNAQAMRNRQQAQALREQLRRALEQCAEPDKIRARDLRAMLTVTPLPSLRTVQENLKIIRAESSVSRDELGQDDSHGN